MKYQFAVVSRAGDLIRGYYLDMPPESTVAEPIEIISVVFNESDGASIRNATRVLDRYSVKRGDDTYYPVLLDSNATPRRYTYCTKQSLLEPHMSLEAQTAYNSVINLLPDFVVRFAKTQLNNTILVFDSLLNEYQELSTIQKLKLHTTFSRLTNEKYMVIDGNSISFLDDLMPEELDLLLIQGYEIFEL